MQAAADTLRQLAGLPRDWVPQVAVVLGSGLGGAADRLLDAAPSHQNSDRHYAAVAASHLPGLAASHVAGHRGHFVPAVIDGLPVLFQQGRIHAYEGHCLQAITASVRLFAALGCRSLILTNAAGSINSDFRPGDLMLIRDHLRMPASLSAACSELPVTTGSGPSGPWTKSLLEVAAGTPARIRIHTGIYAMMPGPAYETPAEVRMLRTLGADAVGMSTVPEALQAMALGLEVLGISCITNIAAGLQNQPLSHTEVTETGRRIEADFAAWLQQVLLSLKARSAPQNGSLPTPSRTDPDG